MTITIVDITSDITITIIEQTTAIYIVDNYTPTEASAGIDFSSSANSQYIVLF